MPEYITKQSAIDALGEEPMVWTDSEAEIQEHLDWERHREAIMALPAVDARRNGHWIAKRIGGLILNECSECGNRFRREVPLFDYCPMCGSYNGVRMVKHSEL